MEYTILSSLVVLLVVVSGYLYSSNSKKAEEVRILKEVLEMQNITISNMETSCVAVKDVIDNFSVHEEVMERIEKGESRADISEELNIPLNKIELIVKFDKIKKEQSSVS